jgi:hypothetical protein
MSDHVCNLFDYAFNTFCILFYLFIYCTIEREGAEEGDEEDGEEAGSPNLSIKGHTYTKYA